MNDDSHRRHWLYGIRRKTGAVAWKSRLTGAETLVGPWGGGDRLYAAVSGQERWTLVTVDARTGALGWKAPIAEDPIAPEGSLEVTGVTPIGRLAVAAVRDDRLTLKQSGLVAVEDGVIRWRRTLLNPIAAVGSGGRLFAASYDSTLHEIDPRFGTIVSSVSTPGPATHLLAGSTRLVATIGVGATAYRLR